MLNYIYLKCEVCICFLLLSFIYNNIKYIQNWKLPLPPDIIKLFKIKLKGTNISNCIYLTCEIDSCFLLLNFACNNVKKTLEKKNALETNFR